MVNKLRKMMRNEKGFTLVELLAVIVILGIIAAIAVPSIAGIIDNSKKDAHRATAMQMIEGARLALASGMEPNGNQYTLDELVDKGFIESVPVDPEGASSGDKYHDTDSYVTVDTTATGGNMFKATLAPLDGSDYISSDNINDLQN